MLNFSRQQYMNFAGTVFDVQTIVRPKKSVLLLDALDALPRHEKRRMKGSEQKHRVKVDSCVSEDDSNDVVVAGEDDAKP
jgi:hypothetical protein